MLRLNAMKENITEHSWNKKNKLERQEKHFEMSVNSRTRNVNQNMDVIEDNNI